jgi:hypothetical protein
MLAVVSLEPTELNLVLSYHLCLSSHSLGV